MATSRLEQLPRELRDLIYAFALAAPYGLIFRTGKNGAGRICERRLDRPVFLPRSSGKYSISRLISSITTTCQSLRTDASDCSSFNQIQLTSRLFYEETHDLEFRYNTILFEDCEGLTAGQRCQQVISKVAIRNHAQHIKASICSAHTYSLAASKAKESLTLIEFCRLYPQISIRLHNPLWSQAQPGFILFGVIYSAVMRRTREPLNLVVRDAKIATAIEMKFLESFLPSDGLPENLRMLPCEERLDESILVRMCNQAAILRGVNSSVWMDLAESWFRDGI